MSCLIARFGCRTLGGRLGVGGAGPDPIARSESCWLAAAEVELVGSNICVDQTVFVLSHVKTAGLEPLLLLHLIRAT